MPHSDVQPRRAVDQLQKAEHRVKIIQRLPDTHEYDVAHSRTGIQLGKEHLVQHLSGCQVSYLAPKSGGTEGTAHAAPHLRRDTYSIPMMIAHQNSFYAASIPQPPQVFDGPVFGVHLLALHHGSGDEAGLGQLLPQRLGEVAHLVKGPGSPMEPRKDLLGPEGGFPQLLKKGGHLGQVHGFQVNHTGLLPIRAVSDGQ